MTIVYNKCEPKNVHQMMPASYMGVLLSTGFGLLKQDSAFQKDLMTNSEFLKSWRTNARAAILNVGLMAKKSD